MSDEPTIGLHPHDIDRMNTLLKQLRDKGNTVLVAEHKPETIAIADHVADLGPLAGTAAARSSTKGSRRLRASDTHRAAPEDRAQLNDALRKPTGALEIRGASREQPARCRRRHSAVSLSLTGSRARARVRSSRIGRETRQCRHRRPAIKGRAGRTRRPTPAFEPIRKAFAQANGVKPALFSANSEGACETCNGAGVIYTDPVMMAGVEHLRDCEGKRFHAGVLEYRLGELNIAEVPAGGGRAALLSQGAAKTSAAQKILERPTTSVSATSVSASR